MSRVKYVVCAASVSISSFAFPCFAQATEGGNLPATYASFYAQANEGAAENGATTAGKNETCFTTNTATEATRGIRHWHGCR